MNGQKLEDIAAAVIPAMVASGTCWAASNCGMAKKAMPLVSPTEEFERPRSHTGGSDWNLFVDRVLGLSTRLIFAQQSIPQFYRPAEEPLVDLARKCDCEGGAGAGAERELAADLLG